MDAIARVLYASRKIDLGVPPNLVPLNEDIEAISGHWREQGIEAWVSRRIDNRLLDKVRTTRHPR